MATDEILRLHYYERQYLVRPILMIIRPIFVTCDGAQPGTGTRGGLLPALT